MKQATLLRGSVIVSLTLLAATAATAQDADANRTSHCLPNELDMGDYCVSLPPARSAKESSLRRITRFRATGMMPGRVGDQQPEPIAPATQSGPAAEAVEPAVKPSANAHADGYGVQFGVFSDKRAALDTAQPLAARGLPVVLAPLPRGERTLWACIHGPFPDETSARAAAARLRIDHRVTDTYIKPLDNLQLTGLSDDATEE